MPGIPETSAPHLKWSRKRRGLYGEVPRETFAIPAAVVGTSPYNLLNGTAGGPRPMGFQSPGYPPRGVSPTGAPDRQGLGARRARGSAPQSGPETPAARRQSAAIDGLR